MNVDKRGKQFASEALRNHIIVSIILENLDSPDLRNLSLVNKLWNAEARKQMRKRGNFVAHLTFSKWSSCQAVQDFGSAIEQMNVVPFSGIHISLDELNHCDACANGTLDPIQTEILARISWRFFAVRRKRKCWPPANCPAVLLVKSVFKDFGAVIEELTFNIPEMIKPDNIIGELIQDCCFTKLRTLKYTEILQSYDDNLVYLMEFVSRAPNLQKLHSGLPINLLQHVLNERSLLYVSESFFGANFWSISEDNFKNLRLVKMDLRYTGPGFDFERFKRLFPMLLETCCTETLSQISMDDIFLVPFMIYGSRLRNLTTFAMRVDYKKLDQVHPMILKVLRHYAFKRIFPNLDKVHVYGYESTELRPDHANALVDQAEALGQYLVTGGAVNIKKLLINVSSLDSTTSDSALQFLGQMFPNIEQLEIKGEPGSGTPFVFGSIWKHWLHLKKLDVGQDELEDFANLDSVFCGIFPQEVAELREKDDEYLKKVNIVPVMPSITCLSDLKTLRLDYPARHIGPHTDDPSFIFSKVTRLIAFSRFPDLTVMVRIYKSLFFLVGLIFVFRIVPVQPVATLGPVI